MLAPIGLDAATRHRLSNTYLHTYPNSLRLLNSLCLLGARSEVHGFIQNAKPSIIAKSKSARRSGAGP